MFSLLLQANIPNNIVQVFYLQNTPKTRDTQYDFSEYLRNSQVYMHNTDKSNKSTRENHDIFANFLQSYMWFCKGKIIKIQATTQNFIVALFYKINPVQNTTIIAGNTENLVNSVPHTIEITIQIGEKFSPIVIKNLAFSQVLWLLSHHYYKLLLCTVSKGAINCS